MDIGHYNPGCRAVIGFESRSADRGNLAAGGVGQRGLQGLIQEGGIENSVQLSRCHPGVGTVGILTDGMPTRDGQPVNPEVGQFDVADLADHEEKIGRGKCSLPTHGLVRVGTGRVVCMVANHHFQVVRSGDACQITQQGLHLGDGRVGGIGVFIVESVGRKPIEFACEGR